MILIALVAAGCEGRDVRHHDEVLRLSALYLAERAPTGVGRLGFNPVFRLPLAEQDELSPSMVAEIRKISGLDAVPRDALGEEDSAYFGFYRVMRDSLGRYRVMSYWHYNDGTGNGGGGWGNEFDLYFVCLDDCTLDEVRLSSYN